MTKTGIPILLYHSVADDPPPWLAPWTVTPANFAAHLDCLVAEGCTALTVSDLVRITTQGLHLPERAVAVTFDDGFADFATDAAPAMAERSIVSTLYVTTGALSGDAAPEDSPAVDLRLPPAPMLAWDQLVGLEQLGVELGAHSHTHPQLDAVPIDRATKEIVRSKAILEERLGHEVASFAYPHGYSSPAVRRVVARHFVSAVAVRNTLSSRDDDRFRLGRLTVRADTSFALVRAWLSGTGGRVASAGESLPTRAWRSYRRARSLVTGVLETP